MKKYNVIVVFDSKIEKVLMCKRAKEPYKGMYNLIGGKIEKENDGLNEAYRELFEETGITKHDILLNHFMNIDYLAFGKSLEVYYGILKHDVELIEEVNTLEWVDINDNFFDMKKYAGEGNIEHIIEEIKIYLTQKGTNTHHFTLIKKYFDFIKYGTKRIELRLNDEKRQKIKIGDTIIFSEKDNTKNQIETKVIDLFKCHTFSELLDRFDSEILADKTFSKQDVLNALERFYTKEDQLNYEVVGIKIELSELNN